ncbi:hypothetical protein LJR078_001028 [Arthrobacter sp. LjRoot78]|uniref:hypothetical protein n=1 Tax=Arthrobacter sp. LjRoot78 TaxID=3342338 RepID=UPI003ED0887A
METYDPRNVPLDQLLLDPNNYRFKGETNRPLIAEKKFADATVQQKTSERLIQDGLAELKKSILSNGFLPVERIVVKNFDHDPEEGEYFVVLEGNRRVATLREIQKDAEAGVDIPEEIIKALDEIPVILLTTDDPSAYLTIMGVRHVGGIKEWGGYQSAKLVFELRNEHMLTTPEVAAKLGLSALEVNRRFRAFQAVEEMRLNEEYSDYVSTEVYPLFHEALSTPKIRGWLGWNEAESRTENEEHRDIFYSLISPHEDEDQKQRPPKITSYSQVREMKTLLDNEDAYDSLLDLEKSFSDAVGLVKADQASRDWIAKVKATNKSLEHVGIMQIKGLTGREISLLQELRQVVDSILETHEASASKTK